MVTGAALTDDSNPRTGSQPKQLYRILVKGFFKTERFAIEDRCGSDVFVLEHGHV
jgi:hypothetical protein